MKKFVCSLLMTIIVLNMLVPVYAQNTREDLAIIKRAEKILVSLGIIDEASKTDEEYYKEITRGEFTKMAICLLGDIVEGINDSSNYFYDTNDSYINKAYSMGLVSGTSYRIFEPDSTISVTDSAVVVLRTLGYHKYAEANGSYPQGYLYAADEADLLKNIAVRDALSYGNACIMLQNALFAPLCEYSKDGIAINNNDNFLSTRFDAVYVENKMVKQTAYASATGIVNSYIGEGYVKIGDNVLAHGSVNVNELLGYNVEYIYRKEKSTEPVLLYIEKYKTKEIEIDIADIEQVNKSKISYKADGNIKVISVEQGCNFIYNGDSNPNMLLTDINPETMSGKITFVYNNNSSSADTVIVWEYRDYVMSYEDNENKIIYYDGGMIDMSDADLVVIYSNEGDLIGDFSSIGEESILSVYESVDKKLYKIVISSKNIKAKVKTRAKSERIVETTEAKFRYSHAFDSAINNVNVGNTYTFLLNFNDEIVAMSQYDKTDNYMYGYMYQVKYDYDEERLFVKIFDGTGTHYTYEFEEKIKIDGARTKPLAYYVALLDMPRNDSRANPQIVKFKLNSDGKISELDTMVKGAQENDNSLNVKGNLSSEWRGRQGDFILTDEASVVFMGDTVIFDVPRDGSTLLNSRFPKSEFKIYSGEGDLGSYNGKLIQFDAVDVDEMGFSDVMVRYNPYDSIVKPGGNIKPSESVVSSDEDLGYMVTDIVEVLDKDDMPVFAVEYFDFKDQLEKCIIPIDDNVLLKPVLDANGQAIDGRYKRIERGDIISMSVNHNGELVGINLCYDSSLTGNARFKHNQGNFDYGIAYNKGGVSFAIASAVVDNAPEYNGSNADEVFDFSQINIHRFATLHPFSLTVPMVVYDTEKDEIRTGRLSDIRTYSQRKVNPSVLIYNTSIWANTLYIIN